MDEIPGSRLAALGMAGAQFIASLQKPVKLMEFQSEPSGRFAGPIGVPGGRGIFSRKTAKVMTQFNSQQRIPTKLGRAFSAPLCHGRSEFIRWMKPRDQCRGISIDFHRRRRCRSCTTGLETRSLSLTVFCSRQTSAMMSGQAAGPDAATGSIRPIVRPLRVMSRVSPCSSWFKTALVS